MSIYSVSELPSSPGFRFAREPGQLGPRRYGLEGAARPGDVIALAGGALVHDLNANGLVDGHDAVVERAPRALGSAIDVLA